MTEIETLENQQLSQRNFCDLNLVHAMEMRFELSFKTRNGLSVFLLNRNDSVVVVLAFELNIVNRINFQKTTRVQAMNHFVLTFVINHVSLWLSS